MSTQKHVFPFLVGCPRSGTTLLRAMVDAHPDVAIPGESHFIPTLARRRASYETRRGFDLDKFLRDILADERLARWHIPEVSIGTALADAGPGSLPDAIRALFATYAAGRRKPLYADKTPGYVRALPRLARLFPEARFVHIVRDGRDVALSLREMEWASPDLATLARVWRINVEYGRRAGERLGPERYLEVRYEELVDRPETTLRTVCAFLGLPFAPTMLRYHVDAERLTPSFRDPLPHAHVRLPPTKGLRHWATQMSREEVALFETIAGTALEQAGYDRATAA